MTDVCLRTTEGAGDCSPTPSRLRARRTGQAPYWYWTYQTMMEG